VCRATIGARAGDDCASASVLVFPRVIVDGTWETTVQVSNDANLLAKAPAHLREELAEDSTPRLRPTWRRRAWRSAARGSSAARRHGPASRKQAIASSLPALPRGAVEGAAHHQRAGAHQRGVPPPDQDTGEPPSEDAVLLLLFGLIRSGQITLRRMVGWQEMPAVTQRSNAA